MLSVQVTISGDKETIQKLQKMGQSFTNMSLAMQSIGQRLSSFYGNDVFVSQGGAIDARWKALSPKYKLYKATGHTTRDTSRMRKKVKMETFPGTGILVRTGDMRKSMKYTYTPNSTTISNTAPYFKYHQLGTDKMPARPVFKVNDNVKSIVYDVVNAYVKKQIAAANL